MLRKVLPHWAKPLWANTFKGEWVAVREEGGKKGREGEGEEQGGVVEQEKKEKQGHREAQRNKKLASRDSMCRLARQRFFMGDELTESSNLSHWMFFLGSCRARSRLRRSSKRFVFDWQFPYIGEWVRAKTLGVFKTKQTQQQQTNTQPKPNQNPKRHPGTTWNTTLSEKSPSPVLLRDVIANPTQSCPKWFQVLKCW